MWGSGATNAMLWPQGKVFCRFTCISSPLDLLFFPANSSPSSCIRSPSRSLPDRRTAAIPTANEGQTLHYLHACVCVCVKKRETNRGGKCVSVRAHACMSGCLGACEAERMRWIKEDVPALSSQSVSTVTRQHLQACTK